MSELADSMQHIQAQVEQCKLEMQQLTARVHGVRDTLEAMKAQRVALQQSINTRFAEIEMLHAKALAHIEALHH